MAAILADAGVRVLDGDGVEIRGGCAGVKGFAGASASVPCSRGASRCSSSSCEAVEEALKLEQALGRLRTPHRIAVLHYSPIRGTVDTEPAEILPFLGSSRLEDRQPYSATLVVHGHAHHGNPEGRTATGVPVYNVSMPVLAATFPDQLPSGCSSPVVSAAAAAAPVTA